MNPIEKRGRHSYPQFDPHPFLNMCSDVTLGQLVLQDPRSRIENALRVASFAKSPCVSVHHFVKASSNANANQAAANAWKSADSLQQQLVSIVLDRLFKLKPEKAKECLALLGSTNNDEGKIWRNSR